MIYGVTGPSTITHSQEDIVEDVLRRCLKKGDTLVSGAAEGVDTVAAMVAVELGVRVHLVVPDAPHNERLVEILSNAAGLVKIERMPRQPNNEHYRTAYMQRNDRLVELIRAGELLAFLRGLDFYRSGEWATVNRANKAGVPVHKELI